MNVDKLKSIISKKANGDNDSSLKLFQMFYFERLLERISKSKYRDGIILKGGVLLSSIIGDDERTTKDLDATLKGIPLTREKIEIIFKFIVLAEVGKNTKSAVVQVNSG